MKAYSNSTSNTVERFRQKQHCEVVRKMIPPIIANGLNEVCRASHDEQDILGCIEDEVALEVELKPL